MVGPTDVVQPWMPRAGRDSDAWLCHVSVAGGARRRGCAAAGVPEFFNGPSIVSQELPLDPVDLGKPPLVAFLAREFGP